MAGCVRLGSRQEPLRRKKALLIGFGYRHSNPLMHAIRSVRGGTVGSFGGATGRFG
jgi:hypothetical protein